MLPELITFQNTENLNDPQNFPIEYYESIPWHSNESHLVEFFPNKIIEVKLITNEDENLNNLLFELKKNDEKIAVDFEWEKELSLIQFCSKNLCLLIKLISHENKPILIDFLKNNFFYGKGMHNDRKMLFQFFGVSFNNSFEDIATTRLIPYGLSENFMEMTLKFAGKPTAEFKVIKMTKSDWSQNVLSSRQVLYAAFDVVALLYCYPNFPPIKEMPGKKSLSKAQNNKPKIQKDSNNIPNRVKNTQKKSQKMNLSVVYKKNKIAEVFIYLVTNYKGTTNKFLLRKMFKNLGFISTFSINNESFLFIESFSPIHNFSCLFDDYSSLDNDCNFLEKLYSSDFSFSNDENEYNSEISNSYKSIKVNPPTTFMESTGSIEIQKNVFLLPRVPFSLCYIFDVLFIDNMPEFLVEDLNKLNEFFFCFGHDIFISKLTKNSCRIEPRNSIISRRIRAIIPFLEISGHKLYLYDYPTFLPILRITGLPYDIEEKHMKKLIPEMIDCKFILKRIPTDSQTAIITLSSNNEKNNIVKKLNHHYLEKQIDGESGFELKSADWNQANELLVIPYTDDVHLRNLRTYELIFPYSEQFSSLNKVIEQFSKYGSILQVEYDIRFNLYHVQYYRHCDADVALSETLSEMHPNDSTIIVRDLPMSFTEKSLIDLFSKFGRITNLVFRDLTPMNILSVVDIFFSTKEQAKEVKKEMNKFKILGTEIHVSIKMSEHMTDWKMSQKNMWVKLEKVELKKNKENVENKFENSIQYFNKMLPEIRKFGNIVDYDYANGHFLIMYDNPDSAKICIDETGFSQLTYNEFVNETSNKTELEIIEKPSVAGNPSAPKELAIVIDPICESVNETFITNILKDCGAKYELHIVPSILDSNLRRVVIYTPSKKAATKVYTILANTKIEDRFLKPKKLDVDDLEAPPPRKLNRVHFEGIEVISSVVIVDPLPNEMNEEQIRKLIPALSKIQIIINNSATSPGCKRAILFPRNSPDRKIILKALSCKLDPYVYLHVFKVNPDSIPQSLSYP